MAVAVGELLLSETGELDAQWLSAKLGGGAVSSARVATLDGKQGGEVVIPEDALPYAS